MQKQIKSSVKYKLYSFYRKTKANVNSIFRSDFFSSFVFEARRSLKTIGKIISNAELFRIYKFLRFWLAMRKSRLQQIDSSPLFSYPMEIYHYHVSIAPLAMVIIVCFAFSFFYLLKLIMLPIHIDVSVCCVCAELSISAQNDVRRPKRFTKHVQIENLIRIRNF